MPWSFTGWLVFAASVVLCVLGALGFIVLGRSMGEETRRVRE
jgi:hypothetical protein